jgi:asparagine synthetase B (glutamine-hydrolysing)
MDFKTEKHWKKNILRIKQELESEKTSFPRFIQDIILRDHLFLLIEEKIIQISKNKKIGILFSGGVDSSVIAMICKKLNLDYCCYSVGFKDNKSKEPEDIVIAKEIAKKYELNFKYKIFNLKEIEIIFKKTAEILKNTKAFDSVNIGVGAVEYSAIELAKKDNCNLIISGLGSEEIFAGYNRHKISKNIIEECWNGLINIYQRDLIRETLIPKHFNVELYAPFLDFDVIRIAMRMSLKSKINKKQDKITIRKIAKKLGLKEFAKRKKRAAQYGSRFNNALQKLAKQNNFEFVKDYINNFLK